MYPKFLFCPLLAAVALACSSAGAASDTPVVPEPAPAPTGAAMKVMSFNIRVDSRDANGWEHRRAAVVRMIGEERPTVMGLQEAQPHQLTYLAEQCPDYAWYGLGRDTGLVPAATDSYAPEECMAIFWRKDEVELLDKGTFWLSATPDRLSLGWDAAYRRTATWCRLRLKADGREFLYMNTHLDHKGEQARKRSIRLIAEKLAELGGTAATVFLTADFNSSTSSDIFDPLRAVLTDARTHAPAADTGGTYNGWGASSTVIDHIFYKGATPTGFNVLRKDYGAAYISDHYPVEATFRVR